MLRLFDHRFDEFAAETHENLGPRAAVAVGAGAVSLIALPLRVCAAWLATTVALELWGWFAGRRQYLRQPVTRSGQVAFLVYLTAMIGSLAKRDSPRSRRVASFPSIPGIMTSMRTMS